MITKYRKRICYCIVLIFLSACVSPIERVDTLSSDGSSESTFMVETDMPIKTLDLYGTPTISDHLLEIQEGQEVGNRIIEAIDKYYEEKGQYPDILDDLIPDYLSEIPHTPSGQAFEYTLNYDIYMLLFKSSTKRGANCAFGKRQSFWDCSMGSSH